MKSKVIVGLFAASVAVSGCNWQSHHTTGTLIGAGAGAGIGAWIGSGSANAVWGGAIGAVGGALVGYFVADVFTDSEPPRAGYTSTFAESADREARDRAEIHFNLACKAMDASTSEAHLRASIDAKPTAPAWNNLGLLLLAKGDRARAQDAFEAAVRIEPGYEPAVLNLAKMKG
jgi:YMGG-like Gly-zipper/Tetratricopeptide repeat